MFLQVKVSTKSFTTFLTGVRFLLVMCVHMKSQVIDLMKRFSTEMTLKCFHSSVSQTMILIVAFLVETFAAHVTNKWFVTKMNAHVRVQGGGTVKSFTTFFAFVWFVLRMDDFMST